MFATGLRSGNSIVKSLRSFDFNNTLNYFLADRASEAVLRRVSRRIEKTAKYSLLRPFLTRSKQEGKMANEQSEAIKIPAWQRTYFLDVKESKKGSKYLVFTESKKNKEGKFDRQRIMIFKDDLPAVVEALKKVAPDIGVTL